MDTQTICISIDVPADASSGIVADALREAADRAATQIEHGVLPHPLEVDENVTLATDESDGFGALLFRSE